TGMGRLGFDAVGDYNAAVAEMNACFGLEGLEITGLFQHFAVADSQNPGDVEYTARQQELFGRLAGALQTAGHSLPTLHSCNSAGQVLHPEWGQGLVRAGIILYGVAPSGQVPFGGLQPVLTLKTTVSQVKNLAPGQSVSYGRLFTANQPMRVATLCCGYADGYPRLLSSQGVVAVCGQPAPVLGRVCMDQMVVDVTHIPQAAPGSEVCVFGGSGPQDSADAAAQKAGTIPYEILSCIGHRVPRVYLENGRPVLISDGLKDLPAFDM
ncbi:MAG: alanine racemase, partial [Oscillospiraceae bacterium]|nr:alanine racemase [Oscillospiraceae bacterium]